MHIFWVLNFVASHQKLKLRTSFVLKDFVSVYEDSFEHKVGCLTEYFDNFYDIVEL